MKDGVDTERAPVNDDCEYRLTKERLFDEIAFSDTVCPRRESDGALHLIAQEMEASDFVPKNTTEQIVRFDEDAQELIWEAICPDWRLPDLLAAHNFVADWMEHHRKDCVFIRKKGKRLVWRRTFWTGWVDNADDVDILYDKFIYDAMNDSLECLKAAQLALGGF